MLGISSGNELEHIQENWMPPAEKLHMKAADGFITFIQHGVKKAKEER